MILFTIFGIIFGIVEGITEWLPVSSTGHLIIVESIFKKIDPNFANIDPNFFEMFLVVIQLGAILAVIITFFKKLWPYKKNSTKEERKDTYFLWLKIIIGCLPAVIFGLLFDDLLNKYLYNALTVSITLIVYGIIFILIEVFINKNKEFKYQDIKQLTFKTALFIGLFQILALIPGTSRSGVTIIGAMLLGCNRYLSIEFSFFLSIPIMFGASILKIIKYLISNPVITSSQIALLLSGIIVSFIVSLFVIKFLLSYIKKHDYKVFGYYRIVLGIILIILFLCKVIQM